APTELGARDHTQQAPALALRERARGGDLDVVTLPRGTFLVVSEVALPLAQVLAVLLVLEGPLDLHRDGLRRLGARHGAQHGAARMACRGRHGAHFFPEGFPDGAFLSCRARSWRTVWTRAIVRRSMRMRAGFALPAVRDLKRSSKSSFFILSSS